MFRIKKIWRKLFIRFLILIKIVLTGRYIASIWFQSDISFGDCDQSCLKLKYQEALVNFQEAKVETTNILCTTLKIFYDNSHAEKRQQSNESIYITANKFACKRTLMNQTLFEVLELAGNHYVMLNMANIGRKFNYNKLECFIERFDKVPGALEASNDSVQMSGKKVYFRKEELYKLVVLQHGYYVISCSDGSTQDFFFDDIISILPSDLLKLKNTDRTKSNSSGGLSSNPVYSNSRLFEVCGQYKSKSKSPDRINVLLIQLGSMSANHFRRMFPLMYEYLAHNGIVFNNFQTVGNDSRSNTMPLLTGATVDEEFLYKFDHESLPLVWKDFEELGHYSMYNEDSLLDGLFQGGLKHPPANHYTFPYWKKMLALLNTTTHDFCIYNTPLHEIYLTQIRDFLELANSKTNEGRGFISINIFKLLTQSQFEVAPDFDRFLRDSLIAFEKKGWLKNTVIFISSDHGGTSYGKADFNKFGVLEYYNPFLGIKMPRSMRHSFWERALKTNRHKMITPFDLHKTLKHIYALNKYGFNHKATECRRIFEKSNVQIRPLRGISLFSEMPVDRSCEEALIPIDFCTCDPGVNVQISEAEFQTETKLTVRDAAQAIVDRLNDKSDELKKLCRSYNLNRVQSVKKLAKKSRQTGRQGFEFRILLEPGASVFKADIEVKRSLVTLVGQIFRENEFEASCLTNPNEIFKYQCVCF